MTDSINIHKPYVSKPRAFICSSKEGLHHAHALQAGLHEKMEVTVWDQGIFELSSYTIDSLIEEAHRVDFAIFMFSPDDKVFIRGQDSVTVRDNVLFELGLFMGILGRKRVYIVAPSDVPDFRIPSDLLGLTQATYHRRSDENLKAALGPACTAILEAVLKVVAADPEPGCAYIHTEESSHIIALDNNRFSVMFQPPMRCTPTLQFVGADDKFFSPLVLDHWSRYGFTVTFSTPLANAKLKFFAYARP